MGGVARLNGWRCKIEVGGGARRTKRRSKLEMVPVQEEGGGNERRWNCGGRCRGWRCKSQGVCCKIKEVAVENIRVPAAAQDEVVAAQDEGSPGAG